MAAEAAGENAKSDEEASTGSVVCMRGVSAGWISAEMSDTDVRGGGLSYCCSGVSGGVPPTSDDATFGMIKCIGW